MANCQQTPLGPLSQLVGTWANEPNLPGRGWNCIALPFEQGQFNYRLLCNQYNETLTVGLVDNSVPNRGLSDDKDPNNADQLVATLEYQQSVVQIAADDFPQSGLTGNPGLAIHHEPGLFLHLRNNQTDHIGIARLASVPHGDSVMAPGRSRSIEGAPKIPAFIGLPKGVINDLQDPYLAPYKHFKEHLFADKFDPVEPLALLEKANQGLNIVKTTILDFDTTLPSGGINNIPFVKRQADATSMRSIFYIQEIEENGRTKLRLQYAQVIYLDFYKRLDGGPGRIRWPHVSINTLEKVSDN